MEIKFIVITLFVIILSISISVIGCSSTKTIKNSQTHIIIDNNDEKQTKTYEIDILETHSNHDLTILEGDTVVWVNKEYYQHIISVENLTKSSPLMINQNFSYTFNQTGSFSYSCGVYTDMKGTIYVKDR